MSTIVNEHSVQQIEKRYSMPRVLLGIEGLAVFIAAIALYAYLGGNGWLFVGLLLAPDLAFIVYLLDKRAGIMVYNMVHTYSVPIAMAVIALLTGWQLGLLLALIWLAHIGMDRTVGYGLKYTDSFNSTHLQRATDQ